MEEEVTRAVELAVRRCHGAAHPGPGEEVGAEEEQQMGDGVLMADVAGEVCHEFQVTDEGWSKEQNLGNNMEMVAREGREVKAKEGKCEVWVVKKDSSKDVKMVKDAFEVKREPQDYVIPKLRDGDRENMKMMKSVKIETEVPDWATLDENHGQLLSVVKVEKVVIEEVDEQVEKQAVESVSVKKSDASRSGHIGTSGCDENRKRKRDDSVGRSEEHDKRKRENTSYETRFFVGGKTGGRLLSGGRKILRAIEKESGTRIEIGGEIGDEVIVRRGSKEAQAEVKAVLQMVNVDFWLNDNDINILFKHSGDKGKLIHQIERKTGTLIDVGGGRSDRRRPVTIVGTSKGKQDAIQCIEGSRSRSWY